jgi:hypothetical protein
MNRFSLARSGRRPMTPTRRRIAWVFGVQIVALAALLMLAFPAAAEHTVALGESGTDQSGECTGDYFKIESAPSVIVDGTHTYTGTTKDGDPFSVTLDAEYNAESELESITIIASDPTVTAVVIKGGGGSDEFVVYEPPEEDMTASQGEISNIAFCLGAAATSPPATSPPATSPPATSPPATSPPATSPPATSPPATSPPATSPPATSPPPGVATPPVTGQTPPPLVATPPVTGQTPPATSTEEGTTSGSAPLALALVLLAAGAAGVLLLAPVPTRNRR